MSVSRTDAFSSPDVREEAFTATFRILEKCAGRGWHGAAALSVVHDGRLLADLAWGRTASGTTPTRDTRFAWTCAGKPATAAAVGVLVDAGRLDLDEPVDRYLPDFPSGGATRYTVRDLLQHQVVYGAEGGGDPGQAAAESADWRLALPPVFDAVRAGLGTGASPAYTVWSANLMLAAVVEAASGERFEDWLVKAVLEPLGCRPVLSAPGEDDGFAPLRRRIGTDVGPHPLDGRAAAGRFWPGVSMRGTARDLVRLLVPFLPSEDSGDAGDTGNTRDTGGRLDIRLLSASTAATMTDPATVRTTRDDELAWGLGLAVDRRLAARDWSARTYGHHGLGGSAIACADPDSGLLVAALFDTTLPAMQAAIRRESVFQALRSDLTAASVKQGDKS